MIVWLLVSLASAAVWTTNAGAPVSDPTNSKTLGRRGPVLFEDQYLVERLQIHNREVIPERNVHARGAVAKGVFRLTHDMSEFTTAKLFTEVDVETEMISRWSTVIHSRGSPEYLRDPRGFALKFYTSEGNYDIVGLNFPIFFIRDGIRFPEMIRALKPNPVSGVQEWWRIWDYFSHYPESLHMWTWVLDDVGIPKSYRHVDGWGVHTFKWINANEDVKLVRYYWKSHQGVESLLDADAVKMPFSNHTYDLYANIKAGSFPKWTLYVQMMDEGLALDFDPLDTTKEWPEEQFPLMPVGEMEFNANSHQFLENEQSAFSPAHLIPGIEPSAEKMLQARLFAYADTQRYRLGVNYQMLPVNRPRCPFHDGHVQGAMNFKEPTLEEVDYYPSQFDDIELQPTPSDPEYVVGKRVRQQIGLTNDFEQPRKRYQSWSSARQMRFVQRLGDTLLDDRIDATLLGKWIHLWAQVDMQLSERLRDYISFHRSE